jgi:hypothetical protein
MVRLENQCEDEAMKKRDLVLHCSMCGKTFRKDDAPECGGTFSGEKICRAGLLKRELDERFEKETKYCRRYPRNGELMETYKNWLRNAYEYYWGEGYTTMTDHEWDALARQFAERSEEFDELRGRDYDGGSLFWMKRGDYPEWAKTMNEAKG